MKKTKVTIKLFAKNDTDLRDLATFTVATDVSILRDSNQNFVVARRSFKAWTDADDPEDELNKLAVEEAAKGNEHHARLSVEQMRDFLEFQVLYDGKPVEVTSEGTVKKPAPGQAILIKLKAKVKLGLLLRVNGVNTLNEQREEMSDLTQYSWWILEPGIDYAIKGFYRSGQVKPFVAKEAVDLDSDAELGEDTARHGKIDMDVFVNAGPSAKANRPNFSFRTVTNRAATFNELKSQIQKSMQNTSGKGAARAFIVGGAAQEQTLTTTTFDGRHVGGLTIRYQ